MTCIFSFGLICLDKSNKVQANSRNIHSNLKELQITLSLDSYSCSLHFIKEENSRNTTNYDKTSLISTNKEIVGTSQWNNVHGFIPFETSVESNNSSSSCNSYHNKAIIDPRNGEDRYSLQKTRSKCNTLDYSEMMIPRHLM